MNLETYEVDGITYISIASIKEKLGILTIPTTHFIKGVAVCDIKRLKREASIELAQALEELA